MYLLICALDTNQKSPECCLAYAGDLLIFVFPKLEPLGCTL